MIKTEKEGENLLKLTCEKAKDAPPFEPIFVELEQVTLGEDASSCILVKGPENYYQITGRGTKPSGTKEILDVLKDSTNRFGTSYTALKRESGLKGGTFDRAFNYLKRKEIIKNTGSANKTNYVLCEEAPDA